MNPIVNYGEVCLKYTFLEPVCSINCWSDAVNSDFKLVHIVWIHFKGKLALILAETYWRIGQHIVEFEQGGITKAQYGKALIDRLSNDLAINLGKGFSRSSLIYMRFFYSEFPISEKLSHLLSWSQNFG